MFNLDKTPHSLILVALVAAALLGAGCYETSGLFGEEPPRSDNDDAAGDDDAGDDDTSAADDDDDTSAADGDGDGVSVDQDCDDEDPTAFPGATEHCDGVDNNCDGQIDEGLLVTMYQDFDGDGWGTEATAASVCPDSAAPWTELFGDCNDAHTGINPGAHEDCDGLDNDCNGIADDGNVCPCELDYYPDDLHPYMFCTQASTWYEAADACSDWGYRLVTFDSQAELTWATGRAIAIATSNKWWLGFNDEGSEGNWEWEDSSTVGFENWCSDEPNNSHGRECVPITEENCAMLNWQADGCWNDYPCACDTMYYICEGNSELRPQSLN